MDLTRVAVLLLALDPKAGMSFSLSDEASRWVMRQGRLWHWGLLCSATSQAESPALFHDPSDLERPEVSLGRTHSIKCLPSTI